MALDGSGSYQPPAPEFPAIPNTTILANDFNTIILDIAAAISQAIFRDGQAAFTANQSMGSHKLTNLAAGTALADAVNVFQVFFDPSFVATTVDGFQVNGTAMKALVNNMVLTALTLLDMSASEEVKLPTETSIGALTSAELAFVHGVTSSIQAQLTALALGKANLAGGNTFTGLQSLLATLLDGSTATTQVSADSSLKLATTAFVQSVAMNSALPGQVSDGLTRVLKSLNGVASWGMAGIVRSARTSNTQLAAGDSGNLIDITSGTFTQTFAAAATLGSGWYCWIRNSGTGDITLDPNASEIIDGLASYVMYPGECRLVQCDGAGFNSIVITSFSRTFAASGSFIKPPGYANFSGLLWAAGGSGRGTSVNGGGGGGGACAPFTLASTLFGTTETVTIGAGGLTSTGSGNSGGNSSIGTLVLSYGGCGGGGEPAGGGGVLGPGTTNYGGLPALPIWFSGGPANNAWTFSGTFGGGSPKSASTSNALGQQPIYGGGAGAPNDNTGDSHNSVWGGAGGGTVSSSAAKPQGTSKYGGSGGAASTSTVGTAGTAPAGGGGASMTTTSGAGARGELRIWGEI